MKKIRKWIFYFLLLWSVSSMGCKAKAVEKSFRFVQIEKEYAIAKTEMLSIYEEKSNDAKVVGSLEKGGLLFLLDRSDDLWYYVESGAVRGFVSAEGLMTGEEARQYVAEKKEHNLVLAGKLCEPMENRAFAYKKITVQNTVAEKKYALCLEDQVPIREGWEADSRIIGILNRDALCFLLAEGENGWVFVESGNVRGFIEESFLKITDAVMQEVLYNGEEHYQTAQEIVSYTENKACYYTVTSVERRTVSEVLREAVTSYALQFIGNPYEWGGTSLTSGADCSGFIQSIYAAFGYELPRVAGEQSECGVKLSVEEAEPGDLIFYEKDGCIYHVVMYLGDGKTIEAANSEQGIICSKVNTERAVWAVRIISDADTDKLLTLD